MKQKHYIIWLCFLFLSARIAAQEIVKMPVEKVIHCEAAQTFAWRGHLYNDPGNYTDTVWNDPYTKDTAYVYRLDLTITDHFERTVYLQLVEGQSIKYRGVIYTEPVKKDTTISGSPCDTLEHLVISYNAHIDIYEKSRYFCTPDTVIEWHGDSIRATGDYEVTRGDTTYHITVTMNDTPPTLSQTVYRCRADLPYLWHGQKLEETGIYTYSSEIKTQNGCDTLYILDFNVVEPLEPTRFDSIICGAISYKEHGKTYYGDRTFTEIYTSQYGCDSIVQKNYITQPNTYFFRNDSIDLKKEKQYYWQETKQNITQAGDTKVYRRTTDTTACDTLYHLYLANITHDTIIGCKGEKPIVYDQKDITQDTTILKITYTTDGWMDKVAYTHIIFHEPVIYAIPDTVILCHGDTFVWYYDRLDSTKTRELSDVAKDAKNRVTKEGKDFEEKPYKDSPCYVVKLHARLTPYYDSTATKVIRSLDTCQVTEKSTYNWKAPSGKVYSITQTQPEVRTIIDTVRYANGQNCDSLYTRRTFSCTSHCSPLDTFYFYTNPLYIKQVDKSFTKLGKYEHFITKGGVDSIYNFVIVKYIPPTPRDSAVYGCWLNPPTLYKRTYSKTCKDTIHFGYHKQPACDSALLALDIQITKRLSDTIYTGFCADTTFELPYLHRKIRNPGTYFDTIPDGTGCDSIVPYHLDRWDNPTSIITKCAWPDSLPFYWKASDGHIDTITQPGHYVSYFHSTEGCDSISIMDVISVQPYEFHTTDTTCSNEPYFWRGEYYNQTGDYEQRFTTKCCGVDSVYYLHLTVLDTMVTLKQIPLYEGGSYLFYGHTLTLADTNHVASVTLTSAVTGCDSLDQVRIVRTPTTREVYTYCESDVVEIGGKRITEDGEYPETWPRSGGGDSTVIKVVHFIRPVYDSTQVELYPNQTISWRGQTITQHGEYRDTTYTEDELHCATVIAYLAAQKPNIPFIDTTFYYCDDNLPFYHKGIAYYATTTLVDTLRNNIQKDSMYIFNHYIVVSHYSDTVHQNLCPGDSIWMGNQYYYQGGYYTQRYSSVSGQDSIFRFVIHESPIVETERFIGTGCDSVIYNGYKKYVFTPQPGSDSVYTFTEYLKTSYGCDSIVHLKMTIHQSKQTKLDVTYPLGDKFLYMGKEYSRDTTDINHFSSAHQCDSAEYLTVRFYNPDDQRYNYLACGGDTIYIHQKPVVVPTNQKEIWINDTTTDQVTTYIQRVRVQIGNPFIIARDPLKSTKDTCSGKRVTFNVGYTISSPTNSRPDYYDIHFFDNDLEAIPSDSTYVINDTNSVFPITMQLKDDGCIYPGQYTYTITFRSKACLRCNRTDTNSIWIYYPADIMYAKWNHFVALNTHSSSTQCDWDLEPPLRWFVNGQEMATESDPSQLYFTSSKLNEGDQIYVMASRRTYRVPVSSYSMKFVPQPSMVGSNGKPQIIVTPTSVPKRGIVNIQTQTQGSYQLYDPTGNQCQQGFLIDGISTISMPATTGFYLLRVTLKDGTSTTERLIIY